MKECRLSDILTTPVVQRAAERVFQFAEPRLVIAPLPEAGTVDRLSDLFGAWRVNGPLSLMKAQASFLEWDFNIVEQPPNLLLEILHKIVVDHPMHPAGQHFV